MKRNITIAVLSLSIIWLSILYAEEKQWHDVVENGMAIDCYLNLEHAIRPLTESSNPSGYDEPSTENAVNKVIDDLFIKSGRGNEPRPLKIVVHNALTRLAAQETERLCDRPGRAADARETIEQAIEAKLRH